MSPTVSVVIPCKNMAAFAPRAIASVLEQQATIDEIVVVDDGSSDDIAGALKQFGSRVRIVCGPGRGSAAGRNLGILNTSGEFIAFLDADDYWRPGLISQALEALAMDAVGLCFANWEREANGQILGEPVFEKYYSCVSEGHVFSALLRENWILTSSVVLRRKVLALSGIFDPLLIGGQDYELWLRLARVTEFARLSEPLAVKCEHGGNITRSPDYAYHMVRVWCTIANRHSSILKADREYIARRLGLAAYNAGRHAVRQGHYKDARAYFRQAVSVAPRAFENRLWRLISDLPAPVLERLLLAKRGISRRFG